MSTTTTQQDEAAFDDASAFDDGFDVTFTDADLSTVTDLPATGTDLATQTVVTELLDITGPLNVEEARELTEHIRSASDVVYVLISRAHAGRAWEALGYESWEKYVRAEFDISRARSYQLLNQAAVIEAIESAVPDGTEVKISEAAARDLRSIIGDITPELAAATAGLPADEAGEVVEELVDRYRTERNDRKTQEAEEAAAERADREGFNGGPGNGTWTPPPVAEIEDDMGDSVAVRRNFQAVYDLYSSLSALKGMPNIQDVINTIPPERRIQVNANMPVALGWLQEFSDSWAAQSFQQETTGDLDDDEYDEDVESM
ncbi:MAG: hypothetical protein ACOH1Y_17450 [Propionicimonas sp.]